MDDEGDIHERIEQLEATVADQQQTIEQLTEPPAVGRRGVLASLLGAGAVGGLAGYGSQSARAEASEPAGQVGTGEEPVDVEAWNLTVQNEADGVGGVENPLTETLEADGNDMTGVGTVETEEADIINDTLVAVNRSDSSNQGIEADEWETVEFDNTREDEREEWDADNYRFTPAKSGWYWVGSSVNLFNGGTSDDIAIRFRDVDGVEDVSRVPMENMSVDDDGVGIPMMGLFELDADTNYEMQVINRDSSDSVRGLGGDGAVSWLTIRRAWR